MKKKSYYMSHYERMSAKELFGARSYFLPLACSSSPVAIRGVEIIAWLYSDLTPILPQDPAQATRLCLASRVLHSVLTLEAFAAQLRARLPVLIQFSMQQNGECQ